MLDKLNQELIVESMKDQLDATEKLVTWLALVRMSFTGSAFCRVSLSNSFTHVASTWGSVAFCFPVLTIQTASPAEQVRWGRIDA
jgi:hypothetical protein